jgi:GAF domain-containing protein
MKQRSRSGGKPIKGRRRKTPAKRGNVPNDTPAPNVPNNKNLEFNRLTRELSEAREQQAATSEVLKAISGSTFDLRTVLDTLLQSAVRLCGADQGTVAQREGDSFYRSVSYGFSPAYLDYVKDIPVEPGRDTGTGRALLEGKVIHIPDVLADPDFTWMEGQRVGGFRTVLGVPMLREGLAEGVLALTRSAVRPFSDEQIALVENFAAQAVIAIENTRLLNELRQSLEQQTATSRVLQVISSSPGDLEQVFATILQNATRICEAKFGALYRNEGDGFRATAMHNAPPAYEEARAGILHPPPRTSLWRAANTKQAVQIADVRLEQGYIEGDPFVVSAVALGGYRSVLSVPMLHEDELVGVITIFRQEVRPFTEEQISLVKNFAAQAVIAIENARLLGELRESLREQTATSEVLQVISSSPGDLPPVFEAMLEKAVRICDAKFGNIYRCDGDTFHLVATHNTPAAFAEARRRSPFRANLETPFGRMIATKTAIQVANLAAEQVYTERNPWTVAGVELGGVRTILAVPMLKESELIGALTIYRQEVRPFADKQIALVTSFATQAVIAVENARLLNELRESLQEQTATAEVLQVINSSSGDLEPVFASMLEKAVRICEAKFGVLYRYDPAGFEPAALSNAPPAYANFVWSRGQFFPQAGNGLDRLLRTKTVIQSVDEAAEPVPTNSARLAGARSQVLVPMLKEGKLAGAIAIYRQEVRPFSNKQIEAVKNFAAQAVIAIENTRLLKELRERTEEVVKLNQHLEQRVADQVGEIERMGKLRRFLPPQVADLIVASGTEKQLESHRREITALFCDLRGFTGFTESADAEDVMALLRDYHAAIGEIIIKYSGTLERYAGDGVMVIFNDPVPVENPALQAVLMALDMRVAIGALTDRWRRLGHEIGFGIGIAHGHATLGTIGFEGRFDYAAIGTVSNVASRLCDEAKPGQILISPRVLMAVEDAVTVEAVGEFELKGIRRPIAAHNVLAATAPNG